MSPANRIILNTLATYGQSVVAMILGLLSARWTLQALGHTDFGLFGVVGSIILLVSFLNGGLSVGVVRFFSFSIGEGKNKTRQHATEELQKWFNTAFSIHLILPLVVVLLGWPLGEHAIRHWLAIPDERLDACLKVFRFALATAFISIFSVPYTAMFRAHQRMVELAVIETVKSVAIFFLALTLLRVESDRLVFYAAIMMLIASGGQIVQIIRATWLFPACRPCRKFLFQREYLRKLFGFVGWKMLGTGCYVIRLQGTPVLANLAYGPAVNAALSIANRLALQASSLSIALLSAFQPALTTTEGGGDRKGSLIMAIQICKFGTFLVALFAIPVIIKMDLILNLWLVDPPPYTADICRWLLAMLVIEKMTAGAMVGVNARGKIAIYEMIQGPLFLLALPLIWLLYKLGYGPEAIGVSLFASTAIFCISRLCFAKKLIDFPIGLWFRSTAYPMSLAIAISSTIGWLSSDFLTNEISSLLTCFATSSLALVLFFWFRILNNHERDHTQKLIKNLYYYIDHKICIKNRC